MHASKKRGTFNCMPQKQWGADSDAPLWGKMPALHGRSESGGDNGDRASQRRPDTTSSSGTERSSHCADDASRDNNVLERHHAVLVRAQVLQRFRGHDVITQHRRNPFFKVKDIATFIGEKIPAAN